MFDIATGRLDAAMETATSIGPASRAIATAARAGMQLTDLRSRGASHR